uniref:phenylalanine--tRNA ligase n=1 Tax=Alexandrium monilatum TaxID=311494 RepID=A0A7S4VCA4_9DINO
MLAAAAGAALRRRARPGGALGRLARGAAGRIVPQQRVRWPAPRGGAPGAASGLATVAPRRAAAVAAPETFRGTATDDKFNVPEGVQAKLGKDLLLKPAHPLGILWVAIQDYFRSQDPSMKFFDSEVPIVSTTDCFDKLRVPPEHPSRSPSDTYYVNAETVLRTHTSAHQCQFMSQYPETTSFLCAGDVYRRDEIDASHYPVFHQCEGVRLFNTAEKSVEDVKEDLKRTLEGLAAHLFQLKIGDDTMRWLDEYFPFTEPSLELEIFYNDDWMEVLGCGVIHHDVLRNAGLDPGKVHGWAFGLGLERLAMVLFGIPDIRLFWSEDPRFSGQFDAGSFASKTKFKPFSKYPPVLKDISMWIPADFVDNDLFEMIRDEGGDQVEKVELQDEFTHPKTQRTSKMFRVTWRDMSRTLTNEEVNTKHEKVLERVVSELQVELR